LEEELYAKFGIYFFWKVLDKFLKESALLIELQDMVMSKQDNYILSEVV